MSAVKIRANRSSGNNDEPTTIFSRPHLWHGRNVYFFFWRAERFHAGQYTLGAAIGIALVVIGSNRCVMPASKKRASAPLTFDLPQSLIGKISRTRKNHGLASASEVVRLALTQFKLSDFEPAHDPHTQISVRIAGDTRAALRRTARLKRASLGEIIRAALEKLPERPAGRKK